MFLIEVDPNVFVEIKTKPTDREAKAAKENYHSLKIHKQIGVSHELVQDFSGRYMLQTKRKLT